MRGDFESRRARSCASVPRTSGVIVGGVRPQRMSEVRFTQYLAIKYTTLAHWIRSRRRQRQRERLLMKAGADAEAGKSNGKWIEAVVDKNGSPARAPSGALRIYFAAGAYCQISSAA